MIKCCILFTLMQLQLCVLFVKCGDEESNLIQRIKTQVGTSMSSTGTYGAPSTSWDSGNAIDNKDTGNPNTCRCCASTLETKPPWLQIDLGKNYYIKEIEITGRSDNSVPVQYQDIHVFVSNSSIVSADTMNGTLIYKGDTTNGNVYNLHQEPPKFFRHLIIRRFSKGFLTICEVRLYEAAVVNILKKLNGEVRTNQSSIFEGDGNSFGPLNAIDGRDNYDIDNCQCCSVTTDSSSWWQIDLGNRYTVIRVEIFGRGNLDNNVQLQDANVFAGNTSLTENTNNGIFIYQVPTITITTHFIHELDEQITAQYFIVTLPSLLTLCEFTLYGIEPNCSGSIGSFGPSCSQKCHCADNKSCDVWTGKCQTPLCLPGWTDPACDKVCDIRKFGHNCSSTCHCLNNTSCNSTTGECDIGLCDSGWQGTKCDHVCDTRKFGYNCSSTCNCLNNTSCNSTTGECGVGLCDSGWQGTKCDLECNVRKFGYNCSTTCHCLSNSSCNSTTGKCDIGLCDSGWQGNKFCDIRKFGNNCSSTCHCRNNSSCNSTTGECDIGLCDSGWQATKCDQVCDNRKFGYNCSSACNCLNNTSCNSITGVCDIGLCDSGWQGTKCDLECDARKFGYNCSTTCHCLNNSSCNSTTGECGIGLCDSGWQGNKCDHECDARKFGYNCSSTCHCLNNTSCNSTTGECYIGLCDSGWQGHKCYQECNTRQFGYNCSSSCHCQNNTSCNSITGECDIGLCDSGWQGTSCDQECDLGRFGDNCSLICHCLNDTSCDRRTGGCDIGLCDSGWQGSSCTIACSYRQFGLNCSSTCNCKGNSTCNEITGECKDGGYCDPGWEGSSCSKASPVRKEESNESTTPIAGGVGATIALVIIGVVIGVIVFRRKILGKKKAGSENIFSHIDTALEDRNKSQKRTHQQAHDNRLFADEQDTSINVSKGDEYYSFGEQFMGIRIHEIWDYIHDEKENNFEKLVSEFKTLPQGRVHPCTAAEQILNRGKNRYKEMYAYDHTRVILEDDNKSGDDSQTHYINACYIDGYEKVKKFVASQGPTKNMVEDFWRMIWQLKSDKIVMLTDLIELGAVKCLLYWPKDDEETECSFGNYTIQLLETEKYLDYNIRVLQVRKNGEAFRRILQFHFKSWPDKDVPDSTWCLINFWRVVNTNTVSTAGPIVVHCSAGVGRTGTFIALDNIVNQARKEGCVRPLQIVKSLRSQRVNMVQTKDQYIYLHQAVADALNFGTHIIWSRQFGDVLAFMSQKDGGQTRLQKQFELIEESAEGSSSNFEESPEYSNVETILSESDAYKPKIRNRGSKFVQQLGALYIPNYKEKSTFLVSMSPSNDTMEEFWSLIDENNIKTVIMLTEQSSTSYQSSCDLGSSSDAGAKFSVNKIEEKKRMGYTQRSFTFKGSKREEEEYLTTVKQFEYTAWKDGYLVPGDTTSLLDMIDTVIKWQPHLSESQPILVHCRDGFSRSGIVCVLLNELQRMKYEGGHINIVESVKMMKKRQRHLISNYEQYKFCYDLIMDHIKLTDVYQNL